MPSGAFQARPLKTRRPKREGANISYALTMDLTGFLLVFSLAIDSKEDSECSHEAQNVAQSEPGAAPEVEGQERPPFAHLLHGV